MRLSMFFLFLFFSQMLDAQVSESDLVGLWTVTEVKVGDRTMTPIAKWAEFTADHHHRSGNGWTQHTIGEWRLDAGNNFLEVENDNGIKDEFGGFAVSFSEGKMHWQREEEGMAVQVVWERSESLPMTHGDQAFGLWVLESKETSEPDDEFAVPEKLTLYMRPDHRFTYRNGPLRRDGIWHAHAHQATIDFWKADQEKVMTFAVEFPENKMRMKLVHDEKEAVMVWRRIHAFPRG